MEHRDNEPIRITLEERQERMEKIDFQKLQRPDWLADGPARFEMLTSDNGPDDQNPAQSKALETKFSELASKYDATRFEHFEEKLDPLRGRIKKATRTDAFIIDVEVAQRYNHSDRRVRYR